MRKNSSSGIGGLILAVACVAVLLLTRSSHPGLFSGLLGIILVSAVLIILLVGVVLFFAFRGTAKDAKEKQLRDGASALTEEQTAALNKGRADLMELRRQIMKVSNPDIRSRCNEICAVIDKILVTLREKPKKIQSVRQFFNYYVPTLGEIVSKYERIERSGVEAAGMADKVKSYLDQIRRAMDKQYANLFEDDKLDMSVEMEAMTLACKRDGLIEDTDSAVQQGESTINLTL